MFDDKSMIEWCNNLKGEEKEFVKRFLRDVRKYDETKSFKEALILARKAVILVRAVGVIGHAELKTPKEVWRELKGS